MFTSLKKVIQSVMIIILYSVIITSCHDLGKNGKTTRISGTFPEFKGKIVTLSEIDIDKAIPIDTSEISESGHFKFKFRRNLPGFYLVKVDNKNYITLILDNERQIEISSSNDLLRKGYEVSGSNDSELYSQFELFLETNRNKVDSLSLRYRDFQRTTGFQSVKLDLDENYQKIFKAQQDYARAFLQNHCQSLASLLVINRRFGERKILEEDKEYKYYIMLDSCLSSLYPDNKHLIAFKKRVELLKQRKLLSDKTIARLSAGNKAPDISLTDISGNEINLYSLAGSPVIIHFWSSIDQSSRLANFKLKELARKYQGHGLKIFAIGLENYQEMWASAIARDETNNWVHVTDFLGTRSGATSLFGFQDTYPYFILLDNESIIRYRGDNLAELEKQLALIGG